MRLVRVDHALARRRPARLEIFFIFVRALAVRAGALTGAGATFTIRVTRTKPICWEADAMADVGVILPAAGRSTRFGDPKQKKIYAALDGRGVWLRAAEPFVNRDDVAQ